jgi:hydroxysqualene dehydroxylase
MNVAIIGAGYAGMAAGVTLAEAGVSVTVYEAGSAPGGRARRVDTHGMPLDNGVHILLGAYRDTLALMTKVGVATDEALLRLPLDWDVHRRFRFTAAPLPAPFHLALGLMRVKGASWRERWSAARLLSTMRRSGYALQPDISVAALLQQHHQGAAFIRYLWEPLCLAALNTPLHEASAQVFLNVVKDGLDAGRDASEVMLARKDLSALLPDPAAQYIRDHGGQFRRREPVRDIEHVNGRFRVNTRGQSTEYTHAICATSPHHVAALIGRLPGMTRVAQAVDALRYEPIYTIYLQYEGRVRLPKPMLGLADRTAQWLFDRGTICNQPGLIAAIISAGGPHAALDHETLAQRVHEDVSHVAGDLPAPQWWRVIAEKRATFACTVDVKRPAQRTPLPGLLLAGDYTAGDYPGTLESAVRSGLACARAVLA